MATSAAPDYTPIYQAAGQEWNVDPALLQAVAGQEAGGTSNVSPAGAQGHMQIMPATQRDLGVTDPNDVTQSIYGGAKYLSQLLDKYQKPELAVAAYNAGPGRVDAYLAGQAPLPAETAAYVPGVTARYQALPQPSAPAGDPAPDLDATINALRQAPAGTEADPFSQALSQAANPPLAPAAADPFSQALAAADTQATPPAVGTPNAEPAVPAPAGSVLGRVGAGVVRGFEDVPDTIATGLNNVAQYVNNRVPALASLDKAVGIDPAAQNAAIQAGQNAYTQQYGDSLAAGIGRVGGQIVGTAPVMGLAGGAIGAVGDVVGSVAPGVTNALTGLAARAGLAGRVAATVGTGAAQGAGIAGLTSGSSDQPVSAQILHGAEGGAILAPVAGALGRLGNALAGTAPNAIDPGIAQLAATARALPYPIEVSAPQMSGNSLIKIANDQSSKLPFSGTGVLGEAQQTAFNQNVAHAMGETATRITPDVMDAAANRIGAVFNGVANRTNIQADPQLLADLQRIGTSARNVLPAAEQVPINRQIMNVLDAAQKGSGAISGNAYQAITGSGADLAQTMRASDARVGNYATQVRDALDSAFQRSASPQDQAALAQARQQYRAMKTVEDLVEKSTDGNISPALLMGQVRSASSRFDSSNGGMAYTGGGPLGDLARVGQAFMKTPPNSGTPDRMLVNSILGGGSVIGGGAAAMGAVNPLTLASVPLGLATNRLAGAYLRSNGLASRLIQSGLNPGQVGPVIRGAGQVNSYLPQVGALTTRNALTGQ